MRYVSYVLSTGRDMVGFTQMRNLFFCLFSILNQVARRAPAEKSVVISKQKSSVRAVFKSAMLVVLSAYLFNCRRFDQIDSLCRGNNTALGDPVLVVAGEELSFPTYTYCGFFK